MSRQIRVADDVYEMVEDYAKKNRRTTNNAFEFLLEKLVESLDKKPVQPQQSQPVINTGRTLHSIRSEIDELKAAWKDDLDPTIVQDFETLTKNRAAYASANQSLWDEYNQLKEEQGV